jgi:hypothetical protein
VTSTQNKKDLVVLVPDRNTESVLKNILSRPESLGIREISVKIDKHPNHDSGCFHDGPNFLRNELRNAEYALIVMDYEWSGSEEQISVRDMKKDVLERLKKNGWMDRAEVIVIKPELENWIWSDFPHVDTILGWSKRTPGLRQWLVEKGMLMDSSSKPNRPKESLECAIREVKKSRSSSLYGNIARIVSLSKCSDRSFIMFRKILQKWFPIHCNI